MKSICEERREGVATLFRNNKRRARALLPGTQLAIYVMTGGGLIGRMYALQPADAYRDVRAGKAPYKSSEIESMRGTLLGLADVLSLDHHNLPPMTDFHAGGVF